MTKLEIATQHCGMHLPKCLDDHARCAAQHQEAIHLLLKQQLQLSNLCLQLKRVLTLPLEQALSNVCTPGCKGLHYMHSRSLTPRYSIL